MSEKIVASANTFGYNTLSPIDLEQWKELISYWLKEEPDISVTADFDDKSCYVNVADEEGKGWIFSNTAEVGKITQQLYIIYLQDKVMIATVRFIDNEDIDNSYTKYFEYGPADNAFNYACVGMELKEMPSIIAYVASTYGLSVKTDVLPEFLDIPHRFTAYDKAIIKRLEICSSKNEPPIVYVPLDNKGTPVVDVDRLSKILCGAAHVVVPASKRVIEALKTTGLPYDKVVIMNVEANAAILPVKGISTYQVSSYVLKRMDRGDVIGFGKSMDAVKRIIDLATTHRMERLIDESIKALEAKEAEVEKLNDEINKLKAKLDYYQEHTSIGKTDESMFKMTESVIYEGEVKDMLLKLCQKEYDIRKNDPEMRDWRRTYLLKDIIDNNELSGGDETIISALKETFGTKGAYVTDNMSRAISKYGFEIKKLNGGHNSITLNGDDRLTSVISSTESDSRATKNFLSNYINKLFR